jgi:hypothetical protein
MLAEDPSVHGELARAIKVLPVSPCLSDDLQNIIDVGVGPSGQALFWGFPNSFEESMPIDAWEREIRYDWPRSAGVVEQGDPKELPSIKGFSGVGLQ